VRGGARAGRGAAERPSSVAGATMMGGMRRNRRAQRRAPKKAGAAGTAAQRGAKKLEMPDFLEYVDKLDFTGAQAILEFQKRGDDAKKPEILQWLAYAAFHLGDYRKAADEYAEYLAGPDASKEAHLYLAACHYYMQNYSEAMEEAAKGPASALQNRIMFHSAHRLNDETRLMAHHQKLKTTKEDQLSLAAIHYLRGHFQEATDIYKRLLLENRDDIALNVYVAMCYYKLDYYDVSLEILAVYLQSHPASVVSINLKACNHFKLYNGKAAEAELRPLTDQGLNMEDYDIIVHNLVVFRGGENALQVLPPLLDYIPEARLNLAIFHLRNDDVQEAFDLIKDLEPSAPQEYILKGVVNAALGQATGSKEHLKKAQQFFQLVGASASECDTIPGRQCMASCFFLLKQFEDVNIYLKSIKAYMHNDDGFTWNHGIALAASGEYAEAEEVLLSLNNEKSRSEFTYISWLARCYIMNHKPRQAWELYLKMETSPDSFNLLQLISNDCYQMGQFFYSAKAFDVLERLDPDAEYWEGKRGACVGVLQAVIAGKESNETLQEVMSMLRNTTNPQVEYILRVANKWFRDRS